MIEMESSPVVEGRPPGPGEDPRELGGDTAREPVGDTAREPGREFARDTGLDPKSLMMGCVDGHESIAFSLSTNQQGPRNVIVTRYWSCNPQDVKSLDQ